MPCPGLGEPVSVLSERCQTLEVMCRPTANQKEGPATGGAR
ncbi:hypothetical protein [Streptomyces sp. NPDC101165]